MALGELRSPLDGLAETGAAVAVSARVGRGRWSGWPTRLVNRLLGGLALRIDPPGPASRRRYLLDRARGRGLRLAADAVEALADAADGYRTLDGHLARLALEARSHHETLGRDWVEPILTESGSTPDLTLGKIAADVAAKFGVRLRDLRSGARHAGLVGPRHLAM